MIGLGGGPPLESGGITRHGGEVAVVKPVQDRLFLFQAGKALSVGCWVAGVFAESKGIALLRGCLVILLDEAGADEDDVANSDVSSLGSRPDVETLSLAAGFELRVGDCMWLVAAVGDILGLGVGPVVEQEDAAGGPVVDAVFVVGTRTTDIGRTDAVVKAVGCDMGELLYH